MVRASYIVVFILVFLISQSANCQDSREAKQNIELQVAGSALLAVAGPPVKLILAGAVEAGGAIQESVENDLSRLLISSQVNSGELRSISAKISEPLVGTTLSVELKDPNSHFVYPESKGTLTGAKQLSDVTDVTLAEGIGTCWSGTSSDDGYVIKYLFKAIPNAPILKSAIITVTFTISTVTSDANV